MKKKNIPDWTIITGKGIPTLSSTFIVQHRCRKCGGKPEHFFIYPGPEIVKDHFEMKRRFDRKKNWTIFNGAYYKNFWGSYPTLEDFRFPMDMDFSFPSQPKKSGRISILNNVVEGMTCQCGHTAWNFNDIKNKGKPEIHFRRARKTWLKV